MKTGLNIGVIGAGYVGLITGVCLASKGFKVTCWDNDERKISLINQGKTPIFEKGLEPLLSKTVGKTFFAESVSLTPAKLRDFDVVFVCVGTPSALDGSVDLTQVFSASKLLAQGLKERKEKRVLITVKSTVVPGSTEKVKDFLEKETGLKAGEDFGIAMSPEFLREGLGVEDFFHPDRLVFGVESDEDYSTLSNAFAFAECPKIKTDLKTAEMIKYASNAFLATKISFVNELGNLCKKLGIDSYEVAAGMGLDSRIGGKFLESGVGFGGSCFPKDVKALVAKFKEENVSPALLEKTLEVNERQPLLLVEMAKEKEGGLKGKKVGVLGLAFKQNTDDMRESRAVPAVNALLNEGARVIAFDPKAMENAKKIFGSSIEYAENAREAVEKSDFVFVLTAWDEFKKKALYGNKRVYAGRRIFEEKSSKNYEGICW
ncbi:MAG: UDP-glucose/GDP-mannose dehydrogenase family protein [Candidatus Norongarragalinales archaeon]